MFESADPGGRIFMCYSISSMQLHPIWKLKKNSIEILNTLTDNTCYYINVHTHEHEITNIRKIKEKKKQKENFSNFF